MRVEAVDFITGMWRGERHGGYPIYENQSLGAYSVPRLFVIILTLFSAKYDSAGHLIKVIINVSPASINHQ